MSRETPTRPDRAATRGTAKRHDAASPAPRLLRPAIPPDRRRGLTLVELMVVIVILGILATTVTISVRDYLVTGKQSAAKQEVAQLVAALELFYVENSRYPTNDEGLAVLLERTDQHPDGLLRGGDLNDPWGHAYEYVCPGVHGTFDVMCYGADGLEGGSGADADIVSWEMK